ncbi:MAG: hypothetical protein EA362_12590 [Saprospirales bacterium]|nr:MAG: hypothetical protein EA362_12590 [Saprospirales bacterium]
MKIIGLKCVEVQLPLNFWDEQGNKLLENGTGHKLKNLGQMNMMFTNIFIKTVNSNRKKKLKAYPLENLNLIIHI